MPAGVLVHQQCCCCCAAAVWPLGFATTLCLSRQGFSAFPSQACLASHSVQLHTFLQAKRLCEAAGRVAGYSCQACTAEFQGTQCGCLDNPTSNLTFALMRTCAAPAPVAASERWDATDAVPIDWLSKDSADRCDAEESSGPSTVPTY